jgi:glycine/D-amino acid oxidase-like deaminating enzyme
MADRKIGKQAVVIGAGMAGLAAAGAIADYFERVIVLDRDRLPTQAAPRLGTPCPGICTFCCRGAIGR